MLGKRPNGKGAFLDPDEYLNPSCFGGRIHRPDIAQCQWRVYSAPGIDTLRPLSEVDSGRKLPWHQWQPNFFMWAPEQ